MPNDEPTPETSATPSPSEEETPTPSASPQADPTPEAPSVEPAPVMCGSTVDTACHVHVSPNAIEFGGTLAVLVLVLLAAILAAQIRRP